MIAMVMHLDVIHPVLPWVAVIIYSKDRCYLCSHFYDF